MIKLVWYNDHRAHIKSDKILITKLIMRKTGDDDTTGQIGDNDELDDMDDILHNLQEFLVPGGLQCRLAVADTD